MVINSVINNETDSRYEIHVDGQLAGQLDYQVIGDVVALVHTEVGEEYGGQGLGGRLAQFALEDIAARGLKASPICPFVQKYLEKHPEHRVTVR